MIQKLKENSILTKEDSDHQNQSGNQSFIEDSINER